SEAERKSYGGFQLMTATKDAEDISETSNSNVISNLVKLAEYFQRTAAHGPYEVDMPLQCAVFFAGKGFRRFTVPAGHTVTPDTVLIGKKSGLIFRLSVTSELKRDENKAEYIEVSF